MATNRKKSHATGDIKSGFVPNKNQEKKHQTYQGENSEKNNNGYTKLTLSDAQKDCLKVIQNNILTFVKGPAGAGKSLAAFYYAVMESQKNHTQKIIVIRTPVESGKDRIGFLPDDLSKKLEPHFASTKILLETLLTPGKVDADLNGANKKIQFLIPNYALGATFDNCTIIIDEAQMLEPLIMKLLLERTGINSKVIVLGDPTQVYAKDHSRNGLSHAYNRFFNEDGTPKFEDVGTYSFGIKDIMRSDFVKTVISAYSGSEI
jgi:phosphate starvation-inducible PhoH-like protein